MIVKTRIVNSPALVVFDPSLPTIVSTDASDYGLGAILTQVHPDNTERTVAFASRSLTPAERKYSIVEKEALACVWAAEKWRTFLWGTRFTLRTDHQALTTLLATKGLGRAGMRIAGGQPDFCVSHMMWCIVLVHKILLLTVFPGCLSHQQRMQSQ